ncbi:MAG: tryptophan-rich sensory protein [Candidatus Iainarchaeum archaeon]|uniref:Tryptophan-rich sensory protein n=1 Tax=Candidatus Iainarchaeum sp. TaxID=3101447 RepID=A0A7T9DKI5_9ARCH|nr:MAG: tryptophan-rich sensory protein [Candidatus Diapherotrites archaeon]
MIRNRSTPEKKKGVGPPVRQNQKTVSGWDIPKLIASIGVSLAAGFIGSFFTIESIATWYLTLKKPFFNPPNWVFGPVWTILYILMGWALYCVWTHPVSSTRAGKTAHASAYYWFAIQLVLNALWSILFFGWKNPLLGLATILLLWFSIGMTVSAFFRVKKTAAFLLLPYWAWVSFATLLNLSIVLLN